MARIFISYSHQDEAWKERVVRQLGVLAGEGLETWDDRRIAGGDAWLPAIEQAIATCDVALLLISADFLTSRFILGQEVPPLLQRREQQDIRVIPLILSPCQWQRVGWLQPIQARPKDGADLAGMSKRDAEAALSALAGEVHDLTWGLPPSRPAVPSDGVGVQAPIPRRCPLGGEAGIPAWAGGDLLRPGPALHPQEANRGSRDQAEGAAMMDEARRVWRDKLDFLLAEEAKASSADQRFELAQRIKEARGKLAELGACNESNHPKIDLTHLPPGAEHFLGRAAELAALDAAWAQAGRTPILELTAPGGTGKTALVKRWLERLRADGWRGAQRVYAWSFYSQGTGDDRQASEDGFLADALDWFEVEVDPALNPWDKGRALAQAVRAGRSLLVLDGLESLQYPPGPLAGGLRAPGLQALLGQLAGAGQPGLCLLTSRERIADLAEHEQGPGHPGGGVQRRDLGNLDEADGARLLHALGARRAGAAAIGPADPELRAASRAVRGHALTLGLLGRYLALAYAGDIRRRDSVDLHEADAEALGGHAFRVMAAYETWLAREGEQGARELAALRLLGLFDRPAAPAGLAALRAPPAIPGLTEPLVDLSPAQWRATLRRLADGGLVAPTAEGQPLDAHPLVREYLAQSLEQQRPAAGREGHRRLYAQLTTSCPQRPEGLAGLAPLYQAVAHGCRAGLQQQACGEVYRDRILRGTGPDGFYSSKKLGAFGADLGALACFFAEPWRRPAPALDESDQAWLLNEAAFSLRALSRLEEALEPMGAGAERYVKQENWKNAAASYGNLSELYLTLGRVAAARAAAEQAVAYADRSGEAFQRMAMRTTLADALHQQGEGAATALFQEAEALQAQDQPQYPLLYSLRGFQYCDRLLAGAERAAWRAFGVGRVRPPDPHPTGSGPASAAARGRRPDPDPTAAGTRADEAAEASGDAAPTRPIDLLQRCGEVAERAAQTLRWVEGKLGLLDEALDHLTLARCALYAALLRGEPPQAAREPGERALAGLRAAGAQEFIVRGLLTRAGLLQGLGDPAGARADLEEAGQIAARGGMRLFQADCHLTRARLFRDPTELPQARALIEQCGYGRRLPELQDAEAALGSPAPLAPVD